MKKIIAMFKCIFPIALLLHLSACVHQGEKQFEALIASSTMDSLGLLHVIISGGTGSTGIQVDSGNLKLSDEFRSLINSPRYDTTLLVLTGNFDHDIINNTSWFYDDKIKGFYLIGKVVGFDSNNVAYPTVPIFQVASYKAVTVKGT